MDNAKGFHQQGAGTAGHGRRNALIAARCPGGRRLGDGRRTASAAASPEGVNIGLPKFRHHAQDPTETGFVLSPRRCVGGVRTRDYPTVNAGAVQRVVVWPAG